jgi:hypothetical protein
MKRSDATHISSDDQLDASKCPLVVPRFFHHGVESLEMQVLDHTYFVDHKHISLLHASSDKFPVAGSFQFFQRLLMMVRCPPYLGQYMPLKSSEVLFTSISPCGGAVDVQSCSTSRCNYINFQAHISDASNE